VTRIALRLAAAFSVLAAAAGLFPTPKDGSSAASHLNILLVTIDTLRWDRVGAYGGRIARTPNMDKLAAEGCLFEQSIVQVPLTRASHASILTGLYPFQHGIRDNFAPPLAPEHRTLAEILKGQGYRTGGFVGSFIVNTQSGLGRGFDEFDDSFEKGAKGTAFFTDYQRRAGQVEEQAGPWLEQTAHEGTPFFAWVHFYDPHSPYAPPQPYLTRYAQHLYEGEVAYTDEILGRLLSRLDQLGVRDRTLVVVTSDHGEALGEHGEEEHGFFVYEAVLHVPLIIRLPGRIPRGVRVKAVARSIDLVPTVLDLAGLRVAVPAGLPGRSLVPALAAPQDDGRVPAYSESLFPRLHFGWGDLRSIRMGGWKFIQAPRPELYDLTRDPAERNNLFAAEGRRAAAMRSRLLDTLGGSPETAVIGNPAAKIDPATLEKLASLGYVSGPGISGGGNADPKDKIGEFMAYGKSVRLAMEAYDRGDLTTAVKNLQAIVSAGRGGFDVSFYLGRAHLRLGNYQAAVPAFREAIRKLPTYTPSYIDLAKALVALKQYDEAMAALREGLARDPGNFQFHSHLGFIARARRDLPTARRHYETARSLEPNDFDVRMNLSSIYRDMGEPRLALEEVDFALKLQPDSGDAHNQRGMLLGGLGDNAGAAAAFERASVLEPKNEMIWFNLGLAHLRAGNRPAAANAFRKALALRPDFEDARKMLAQAER
jgi:arylsulfatase A-like enzyme/tetratricopeptide (TPR) repeat protein